MHPRYQRQRQQFPSFGFSRSRGEVRMSIISLPLSRVSSPFSRHHTTQIALKEALNPCLMPIITVVNISQHSQILQHLAARQAAGKCHQEHAESETGCMGLSGACPWISNSLTRSDWNWDPTSSHHAACLLWQVRGTPKN